MSRDRNTQLLMEASSGGQAAALEISEVVYEALRAIASRYLRRERRGHTLRPTDLAHEAYLSLVDGPALPATDRSYFMSLAACAMRRVLVAHARNRQAEKRGGGRRRVPLEDGAAITGREDVDLVALDEALSRLGEIDPRRARVVELRFFAGLTAKEIAAVLGVSVQTVQGDWYAARAWLHRELGEGTVPQ